MRKILVTLIVVLAVTIPVHGYITARKLLGNAQLQNRWASMPVTWVLNTTQGTKVTGAETGRTLSSVTQNSFDVWEALKNSTANIDFTRGTDSTSLNNDFNDQINVVKTNMTQTQWDNAGGGSALAITLSTTLLLSGDIYDADIVFNPAYDFSLAATTPTNPARYDYESVLTHEIGHLLGLDHSAILSATMYPRLSEGVSRARALSTDDIIGISTVYPLAAFQAKGSISGTVRLSTSSVYGAIVVAVNANGAPVAHGISDPQGNYVINGLDAGTYTVFAEPMDAPYQFADQSTLNEIFPNRTNSTSFTTRFR